MVSAEVLPQPDTSGKLWSVSTKETGLQPCIGQSLSMDSLAEGTLVRQFCGEELEHVCEGVGIQTRERCLY